MSIAVKSIIGVLLTCFISQNLHSQLIAFPGADGFGKYTTGGRNGIVIEVTNLNDDGTGSLRAAINTNTARTIVFKISGTIELKSDLRIKYGDLTIAGQTAPGDGICIKKYSTILDADNVIIRYMRFRPGDELSLTGVSSFENDGLFGRERKNIIVDHCSMSWAIDEVSSFYDNTNFTLQWCIIAESLYKSYHSKGNHGYGGIWGGMNATFHHNLIMSHSSRNPRFCGARYHLATSSKEIVDFRNNVIINWGNNSVYGGEGGHYNMVNNYYKPGPATGSGAGARIVSPSYSSDPLVDTLSYWYLAGNYMAGNPNVTADNWIGFQPDAGALWRKVLDPFTFLVDSTQSAENAYKDVTKNCGANLPQRDSIDVRHLAEAISGKYQYGSSFGKNSGIIDSQTDVGGYPQLFSAPALPDNDHDGMPNDWEILKGLNPNDPSDRNTNLNNDGYTALENYINNLTAFKEFIEPPSKLQASLADVKIVKLSWIDNSKSETNFIIERKTTSDFVAVDTISANLTEYLDTALRFNTAYCYRIKARNTIDSSVYSNEITISTIVENGLPLKSTITEPVDSINKLKMTTIIQWEAGVGANSHDIYFGKNYPPAFVKNTSETQYIPEILEYNTKYFFKIDEVNNFGKTTGTIQNFTTRESAPAKLVGYWNFEDVNKAEDKSGYGNNGIIHNLTTESYKDEGVSGKSLFFNGVDQYIQIPHSKSIDFDLNSFTINFWLYQDSTSIDRTTSYRYLVKGSNINNSALKRTGKRFEAYHTPAKSTVRFCIDDDVVKTEITADEKLFVQNKWVMYTGIRDSKNKIIKLYSNNKKVAETNDLTGDISQTEDLYMSNCLDEIGYLSGGLDEVRIYGYALSDAQVDSLYRLSVPVNTIETVGNNPITIFPNPAKDKIYISANMKLQNNLHIAIYDMNGKQLLSIPNLENLKSGNRITSNISSLNDGFYILTVSAADKTFRSKLIVKK